jgi:hypothetical protein
MRGAALAPPRRLQLRPSQLWNPAAAALVPVRRVRRVRTTLATRRGGLVPQMVTICRRPLGVVAP